MGRELDRVEAMSLDPLQVPVLEAANCVSLRYQVAQKIDACNEVFEKGARTTVHATSWTSSWSKICCTTSAWPCARGMRRDLQVRDKHTWPATVTVYDSWRIPFAELARENGFTPDDIDEAAAA